MTYRRKRILRNCIIAVAVMAYSVYVYSFSGGITGRTQKNGAGCTCHGASPTAGVTVTISGPDTLEPNQTASYSVVISGGPAVAAGTNIAASGGTLNLTAGTLQKIGDELTHIAPLVFEASSVSFDFSYTAPATEGAETLYANGNSVNNTGGTSGDQWNFAPNKRILVQLPVVPPSPSTVYDTVAEGWNLVSLPLAVGNSLKDSVFPFTTSAAFAYDGTYIIEDSLKIGRGYWLRFDTSRIIQLDGQPVVKDTIDVIDGWNLVGSISRPVPIESLKTIPSGIIASAFFGYGGTYVSLSSSDSLRPAKGYWVKVSQAGQIVLARDSILTKRAVVEDVNIDRFNVLTITDAAGHRQSLFFGGREGANIPMARFELPPKPPEGSYDVRFASGRFAEVLSSGKVFPIEIGSARYPVMIEWKMRSSMTSAALTIGAERVALVGQGAIRVTNAEAAVLLESGAPGVPQTITLLQNYPNPFNPSTTLSFAIGYSSHVTMKVFDLLGREIAAIVNEELLPGEYTRHWNGSTETGGEIPGGTYFVQLSVVPNDNSHEPASTSRKIILLK